MPTTTISIRLATALLAASLALNACETDTEVTPGEPPAADESTTEEAEIGTADNPYVFGQPHTRSPGFLGAGWTVSIDGWRHLGEVDDGHCIAVYGSATLDSLDSDELTSNPASFPEVVVIDDGVQHKSFEASACFQLTPDDLGEWALGMELIEGGSTEWYTRHLIPTDEPDTLAIETEIYAAG